ncbi:Methylated-DNA--protein-cysteine methyltransferase, partial [hydrothermal vent metagenome]
GELVLGSFDGCLCLLDFRYRKMRTSVDKRIKNRLTAEFIEQDDEVLREAKKQLLMVGTGFQKSVWNALMEVPYGTTSTYLQLAKGIDNEKAVQAVGSANGANSIALIIPCHRIIGSNGELVGYGGGLPVKQQFPLGYFSLKNKGR